MPIIMETSLQAKIVIPMAVSLAFGVLFATVITLILIPCQYVALEDLKRVIRKFRGKESTSDTKLSNTIMVDKTTPSH